MKRMMYTIPAFFVLAFAVSVVAAPPGQAPSRPYIGRPATPQQSKPLTPKQSKPLTPKQSQPVVSRPVQPKPSSTPSKPKATPPKPPKDRPEPPREPSHGRRTGPTGPHNDRKAPPPPPPRSYPATYPYPSSGYVDPWGGLLPGNPPPPLPPPQVSVSYGWLSVGEYISGGAAKEVLFGGSRTQCEIEVLQGQVGFNTVVLRRGGFKESLTVLAVYRQGDRFPLPIDRNVTGIRISDTAGGRYRVLVK